jgi:hypothetical protein
MVVPLEKPIVDPTDETEQGNFPKDMGPTVVIGGSEIACADERSCTNSERIPAEETKGRCYFEKDLAKGVSISKGESLACKCKIRMPSLGSQLLCLYFFFLIVYNLASFRQC